MPHIEKAWNAQKQTYLFLKDLSFENNILLLNMKIYNIIRYTICII